MEQNRRDAMQELRQKVRAISQENVLDEESSGHHQMQRFLHPRVVPFAPPDELGAWMDAAGRLRRKAREIVLRGIPSEEVRKEGVATFQGTIKRGDYVVEKLTFDGYPPGVTVPALLYRPSELRPDQKVPGVLNPVGHFAEGMSRAAVQKRCINLAKRGMLAMSFDWVGFGQLRNPEERPNPHNEAAWLELCGQSAAGALYLSARRALDVLLAHPNADHDRVAVTGLSGGGWQTIMLGAVDTRVDLVAPNAGYVDIGTRVERSIESTVGVGDKEQHPVDMGSVADYLHLTALVFPRPMLLIYNEKDICFDPNDAREEIYGPVKELYEQAGQRELIQMHVNSRPGTHNYQEDNRRAFYRFVEKHFFPDRMMDDEERHTDEEVLSAPELRVPMPENTLRGSDAWAVEASRLIEELPETDGPPQESEDREQWSDKLRGKLKDVLRYRPAEGRITGIKPVENDHWYDVHTLKIQVGEFWELPGYVFTPPEPTGTIVFFSDHGKDHYPPAGWGLLRARKRLVCVDVSFTGEMTARQAGQYGGIPNSTMVLLMDGLGARALGVQATQIVAVREAVADTWEERPILLWTRGSKISVAVLAAASVAELDDILVLRSLPDSLKDLVRERVEYGTSPTLFCPFLLPVADIPHMLELLPRDQVFNSTPRDLDLF